VTKILTPIAAIAKFRSFLDKNSRWIAGAAITCLVAGALLANRVEPGIRVESITIAGDTPALHFIPAASGPRHVALLCHGFAAWKETLFRYGEALAAAGFDCYSVDLPGYGSSPRTYFSFIDAAHALEDAARAVGPVDVFLGHSMGGGVGGAAVRDGGLKPKLFIALGANPHLGKDGPPLLLLAGRFEEAVPVAVLKQRTDVRLVLGPWSEHCLELWDPVLVHEAVKAACAAVGQTSPPAPTVWRWRLAGEALGMLGALGLAFCLPTLPPRWAWARGLLVPVIFIVAMVLTNNLWLDRVPHPRLFPGQIAVMIVTLLVVMGAGPLRVPRWSFVVLNVAVLIGSLFIVTRVPVFHTPIPLALVSVIFLPGMVAGTAIGGIAAFRGSRRDGDLAMAIIVGWFLIQLDPHKTKAADAPAPKPSVAVKLDTKLYDACVGQYLFSPNILYGSPVKLTIRRQQNQLVGECSGENARVGAFNIYPTSETNFFDKIDSRFTFIKNDHGEVTAVVRHLDGWPEWDWEGKKLKKSAE
jgi:hypothetical protein